MADNKKALAMCSRYIALDLFLMHLHGAVDRWLSANFIARPPVVDQAGSLEKLINFLIHILPACTLGQQ
jgi:hypothetical protein